MLARAAAVLPLDDAAWAYELKWDGYRALARVGRGELQLTSRTGRDLTAQFPALGAMAGATGGREALIDGEIVALDNEGKPSFQRLQNRGPGASPVVYVAFDLLEIDGQELLREPYARRRERLGELHLAGPCWRTGEWQTGGGPELLELARDLGFEGVIAKRLDSRYEPGRRSGAWVKVRLLSGGVFAIGGWTRGEGNRSGRIGALVLGAAIPDGGLACCGKVGTGFTQAVLDDLGAQLASLARARSPFAAGRVPRGARFCEPDLHCRIAFAEWTDEGTLRQPSFKGLVEGAEVGPWRGPRPAGT